MNALPKNTTSNDLNSHQAVNDKQSQLTLELLQAIELKDDISQRPI